MMIQVSGMFFGLTENQDELLAVGQYERLTCQTLKVHLSFSNVNGLLMLITFIFEQ